MLAVTLKAYAQGVTKTTCEGTPIMQSQPSTSYEYLNANPREFLAATALSSDEFHQLLPFLSRGL